MYLLQKFEPLQMLYIIYSLSQSNKSIRIPYVCYLIKSISSISVQFYKKTRDSALKCIFEHNICIFFFTKFCNLN